MQQLGIHFSIYFNSFVLLHFRCKTGILECKKWFLAKLQKKTLQSTPCIQTKKTPLSIETSSTFV